MLSGAACSRAGERSGALSQHDGPALDRTLRVVRPSYATCEEGQALLRPPWHSNSGTRPEHACGMPLAKSLIADPNFSTSPIARWSLGLAGDEIRSRILFCASAGKESAPPSAAPAIPARMLRRAVSRASSSVDPALALSRPVQARPVIHLLLWSCRDRFKPVR